MKLKAKGDLRSPQATATLWQILKHAHGTDLAWMAIGLFGSILASFSWPACGVLVGETANHFIEFDDWMTHHYTDNNDTTSDIYHQKRQDFLQSVYRISAFTLAICLVHIVGMFLSLWAFEIFSLKLTKNVRRLYFKAILRQEVAWFDQQNPGEFASRITADFKKFENAFNENFGFLFYNLSTAMVYVVIEFVYGWKLGVALTSLMLPMVLVGWFLRDKFQVYYAAKELQACSMASSVTEEAISAIRTVFAFGGQRKEAERYEAVLKPAMIYGFKRNFVSGIGSAMDWFSIYLNLAMCLWYGTILINTNPDYDVGKIVSISWAVCGIGFNLSNLAPFYEALQTGKAAAQSIFEVIQRESLIDSSDKLAQKFLNQYDAVIDLKDVNFAYPTRPNAPVLRGLNLRIESGETVALVGPSGCGKSTVIQLIQRFYDVAKGEVLLDNHDIRQLNVGWLRQQLGVVGQEPVLFDCSIEENIGLGMNYDTMHHLTMLDVENAAKEANAHDFISQLPDGYQTNVGERGTQLSGGQKQRIAIARALIAKPKILLLDEATSALDLESEQIVQIALDRASQKCTTIIIAHRLSTIINADRIIYIDHGQVLEQGTHDTLMEQKGRYYTTVLAQQVDESETEEDNFDQLSRKYSETESKQRTRSAATSTNSVGNGMYEECIQIETDTQQSKDSRKFPIKRLLLLIWMDKLYLMIATITALIYGLAIPAYALIWGEFLNIFAESKDPDYRYNQASMLALLYVVLAIINLICCTAQITIFGIVGDKLTKRLRMMAYQAILQQNIAFFDEKANSPGALCARLANDAADVQGATGLRISMICQAISTVVATIIIGLIYNWRLLAVLLILLPIVAYSTIISSSMFADQAEKDGKTAGTASKTIIEVINSIRTVVSLHKEQYFLKKLDQILTEHYRASKRKCFRRSLVLSIAASAALFAYGTSFVYGGYLMSKGLLRSREFFAIIESIIFGALVVGQSAIFFSDLTKAKLAAISIFELIDQSPIQTFDNRGFIMDDVDNNDNGSVMELSTACPRSKGNIWFRAVHFSYPSRPETKVLDGLSFKAHQGQTVALVGASGCGKSTCIQLLERFYDCTHGKVKLDGTNIEQLPVDWLRSQMALVQQEPILFSYSIKENIAYGDNTRTLPFDQIQQAARMANVHDFITRLPDGYDTPVGAKGVCQLSGGQKQRIAIARALVRDPPILLLDEATSALDTESEQIVQKALDKASQNRTCLMIAHRLKTIVNADKIIVIDQGEIVEEGTHEQLMRLQGHYWRLYNNVAGQKPE